MSNTFSDSIKLKFADGSFDDFYVHSATLDEGISKLYKGVLTVLTVKPYSLDELKKIIGGQVAVKLRRRTELQAYQERYFQGIVTSFKNKGVIFANKDHDGIQNCSKYELIIEPKLSLAKNNKKTRTFVDISVKDLIIKITGEYGINIDKGFTVTPKNYETKGIVFHQREESDFAFLEELFLAYGLNYYFIHSETGFEPKTFITDGISFKPISNITYSPEGELQQPLPCSLSTADEGVIHLSNWEYVSKTVSEDVSLYTISASGMFDYDLSNNSELAIKMQADIEKNINDSIKYLDEEWNGNGDNLSLMPGLALDIAGFSLSDEKLFCTLSEVYTNYKVSWPTDMAIPPSVETSDKVTLTQTLHAIKPIAGKIIYVEPLAKSVGSDTELLHERSTGPLYGRQMGGTGDVSIVIAIVSDSKGSFKNKGSIAVATESNSNVPSVFYAVIDGAEENSTPVRVRYIVPIGGGDQGLLHFPHIGNKVLLLASGNKYYLSGYVADTSSFADIGSENDNYKTQGITFRKIFRSGSERYQHGIDIYDASNQLNSIKTAIMRGGTDFLVEKTIHDENDSSIRTQYKALNPSCKSIRNSINSALEVVESKRAEYDNAAGKGGDLSSYQAALDEAETKLEEHKKSLDTVAKALQKILKLEDDVKLKDTSFRNLDISSDGNINQTATNDMNIGAKNFSLATTGNIKVVSGEDGEIVIESKKAIKFMVGGSTISLTPRGISLQSRKLMSASGPFDSAIKLDSFTGTSIKGMSVVVKGFYLARLGDSLGGVIATNAGNAQVSGNNVSITTNTGITAIKNLGISLGGMLTQLSSLSKDTDKKGMEHAQTVFSAASMAFGNVYKMFNIYKNSKNTDGLPLVMDAITQIFYIITVIIDGVAAGMETDENKFMNETRSSNLKGKEILDITCTVAKLGATIAVISGYAAKMSVVEASSLSLSCTKYTLKVKAKELLTLKVIDANTVTRATGEMTDVSIDGNEQENVPEGDSIINIDVHQ